MIQVVSFILYVTGNKKEQTCYCVTEEENGIALRELLWK